MCTKSISLRSREILFIEISHEIPVTWSHVTHTLKGAVFICLPCSYVCLIHMFALFICSPYSYVCHNSYVHLIHILTLFICLPYSYVSLIHMFILVNWSHVTHTRYYWLKSSYVYTSEMKSCDTYELLVTWSLVTHTSMWDTWLHTHTHTHTHMLKGAIFICLYYWHEVTWHIRVCEILDTLHTHTRLPL